MTLPRKSILWIVVLLGGVLTLGLLSIWNLVTLQRSARGAVAEYTAMDQADATAVQTVWLRDVLRGGDATVYRDVRLFDPLRAGIASAVRELEWVANLDDGDGPRELELGRSAAAHLESAFKLFAGDAPVGANFRTAAPVASLNAASAELESTRDALQRLSDLVPASARRHVTGAADRLHERLLWTCGWLLVVLLVSGVIHLMQYRVLVRPLVWLRDDMRRSAAAGYLERVRPRGDAYFVDVAAVFNGLARELATLYRDLEAKIVTRSRELVRSERLASVGFLAAGVAHEINNPLTVISGYAEMAGKSLEQVLEAEGGGTEAAAAAEAAALGGVLDAQTIIRDEAFRCKEITGRLLSLARGGTDSREMLRLDELARQVTILTKGLRDYRDRRVVVDFDEGDALDVVANPIELKQVLLNLTVNALEAVAPGRGEVRIGGGRVGEFVEVRVADNGKGMSAETLAQVFEPFFTNKRGQGEPGTGLGLSITHAIVENHGGTIRAESDGPGRGSRFVVRLPAAVAATRRGRVASKSPALLPVSGVASHD